MGRQRGPVTLGISELLAKVPHTVISTSESIFIHLFLFLFQSPVSHHLPLCQTQRMLLPSLTCKFAPFPLAAPVCTDLANLPSISGHSGVKRGAPCPVWLVGVGSCLKEAAGSGWPGESSSQVQGSLPSAHGVNLGTGPSTQQRFPGLRASQPCLLIGPGLHSPTADC